MAEFKLFQKVRSKAPSVNPLKLIYYLSVFMTVFSGGYILYAYQYDLLLDMILVVPIFTLFYPVMLMGTAAYLVKHVLKKKSLFELAGMASGGDGLGSALSGLTQQEDEEDGDEE